MPNKRKSAFSNAGGDGYFGVGGYVKKQDVAGKDGQYLRITKDGKMLAGDTVTKEETSAAFDASKAFGDKYSKVLEEIILETPLTKSDVKGKTTEEIVSMLGDLGKSVSSKVSGMIRSYVNAAKKLKKKEE